MCSQIGYKCNNCQKIRTSQIINCKLADRHLSNPQKYPKDCSNYDPEPTVKPETNPGCWCSECLVMFQALGEKEKINKFSLALWGWKARLVGAWNGRRAWNYDAVGMVSNPIDLEFIVSDEYSTICSRVPTEGCLQRFNLTTFLLSFLTQIFIHETSRLHPSRIPRRLSPILVLSSYFTHHSSLRTSNQESFARGVGMGLVNIITQVQGNCKFPSIFSPLFVCIASCILSGAEYFLFILLRSPSKNRGSNQVSKLLVG